MSQFSSTYPSCSITTSASAKVAHSTNANPLKAEHHQRLSSNQGTSTRKESQVRPSAGEQSTADAAFQRLEAAAKGLTADQKFELLSAYLDDEVSPAERCLVEHWIATDKYMRKQYHSQLHLRAAIQSLMKSKR